MTSIQKIVTKNGPSTIALADYVGEAGTFLIDSENPQILYQDGSTPGGIPIGGGGVSFTGATISLETAAPNDSVNAGLIMASGGTGDMDIVISPIGAGAFALALADGTSTGGNKRGAWATDLQVFQSGKNSPTQVASGQHSFAANTSNTSSGFASAVFGTSNIASNFCSYAEGVSNSSVGQAAHAEGVNNTSNGTASHTEGGQNTTNGNYSHAEGYNNVTNADFSHVEGNNTTAGGSYAHAEGYGTVASGTASHAEGQSTTASGSTSHAEGTNTLADGAGSHTSGQDSWARGINYYQAYSSGSFANRGDQQAGRLLLKAHTVDATPAVMTSDAQPPAATNQFLMPEGSAIALTGTVLAGSTGGDTAMVTFTALLKNVSGTVSVVGTTVAMIYNDGGAASWTVAIGPDNTNHCVSVTVIGEASTTIYWTAEVRSQELTTL